MLVTKSSRSLAIPGTYLLSISALSLLCSVLPTVCNGVEVRVTGDHVNLRAAASEESEVVAQVARGDLLQVSGNPGVDWVSVVPPATASLWIYGDLVKDGAVVSSKAQVRAGPGISYKVVGTLEKERKVTVQDATGEWFKIEPPAGCVLWISGKYVEQVGKEAVVADASQGHAQPPVVPAVEKQEKQEPPKRSAEVTPQPVATNQPSRAVAVHPRETADTGQLFLKNLIETMEQGKSVEYEGVLNYSSFVLGRPSRYILVIQDKNARLVDSCYVMGKQTQFDALVGRRVRVTGKEYWVQGSRSSVVVPSRITLLPRNTDSH
jgi:uncharacterized protein YgiM (DUF1202 family)